MVKIGKGLTSNYTLHGVFDNPKIEKEIVKKQFCITEFPSKKTAYIYLGEKSKLTRCKLKDGIRKVVSTNERGYNIDPSTFSTKDLSTNLVVAHFVDIEYFLKEEV
jgi:hypothetical protein